MPGRASISRRGSRSASSLLRRLTGRMIGRRTRACEARRGDHPAVLVDGLLVNADHVSGRVPEPGGYLGSVHADRLHDLATLGNDASTVAARMSTHDRRATRVRPSAAADHPRAAHPTGRIVECEAPSPRCRSPSRTHSRRSRPSGGRRRRESRGNTPCRFRVGGIKFLSRYPSAGESSHAPLHHVGRREVDRSGMRWLDEEPSRRPRRSRAYGLAR